MRRLVATAAVLGVTADDLKEFNLPIAQQTDREFSLTWISRQFFF